MTTADEREAEMASLRAQRAEIRKMQEEAEQFQLESALVLQVTKSTQTLIKQLGNFVFAVDKLCELIDILVRNAPQDQRSYIAKSLRDRAEQIEHNEVWPSDETAH